MRMHNIAKHDFRPRKQSEPAFKLPAKGNQVIALLASLLATVPSGVDAEREQDAGDDDDDLGDGPSSGELAQYLLLVGRANCMFASGNRLRTTQLSPAALGLARCRCPAGRGAL